MTPTAGKCLVVALLAFAVGFVFGRGAGYAFLGVISAAIAGTIVGAVSIATFVVVQVGRIEGKAKATHAEAEI